MVPFGDLWGPFGSLLGTLWGHSGALGPPWVLFWMTGASVWVPLTAIRVQKVMNSRFGDCFCQFLEIFCEFGQWFDRCVTLVLRTISMVMSVIISVIMYTCDYFGV